MRGLGALISLLLASGVPSAASAGESMVRIRFAAVTSAPSWLGAFWGAWRLEETSGGRVDSSGNGRDLAEVGGSVPSVAAVEGSASADLTDAQESLSRASDGLTSQSVTFGCWVKPLQAGAGDVIGSWSGGTGWELERRVSGARSLCRIGATSDGFQSAGVMDQDVWTHAVCAFSSVSSHIQNYANGLADAESTAAATLASSGASLKVSDGASAGKLQSHVDECFVFSGRLSMESICRICSCGISGTACSCSGSTPSVYVDEGRNDTMCNNCTLPGCSNAAPSVS